MMQIDYYGIHKQRSTVALCKIKRNCEALLDTEKFDNLKPDLMSEIDAIETILRERETV